MFVSDSDGVTIDRVAGSQGLPSYNITTLSVGADGTTLWVGAEHGLASMTLGVEDGPYGPWRFFSGDRWLPGDKSVTSLSTSGSVNGDVNGGAVWASTKNGVARIHAETMSFTTKAVDYTKIAAGPLSRHGWVASATLNKYGDPTTIRYRFNLLFVCVKKKIKSFLFAISLLLSERLLRKRKND